MVYLLLLADCANPPRVFLRRLHQHCWAQFVFAFYHQTLSIGLFKTVDAYVGKHDTRLWRVMHHYLDQARERADFSNITRFGVAETASKRGHNYVSLFVDLKDSKVLFATEGNDSSTVEHFKQDFSAHGGCPERVGEAFCDMSQTFIPRIREHFPKAQITFDKFHIMKIINEATDEVRRTEQKDRPELSKCHHVWLKNPENLKACQAERLKELNLPKLNLKATRAYHPKLNFQKLFTANGTVGDVPEEMVGQCTVDWNP